MNVQELIYRPPRISPTPLVHRNVCPFCHSPGFKAPGPCRRCGTVGYMNGEPPGYRCSSKAEQIGDSLLDLDHGDHLDIDPYDN